MFNKVICRKSIKTRSNAKQISYYPNDKIKTFAMSPLPPSSYLFLVDETEAPILLVNQNICISMYASTPVPATTERNGPNKISKLHSNAKFEIINRFRGQRFDLFFRKTTNKRSHERLSL